jgi:tRNA G26 N,N-dimethylase Trm1
MLADNFANSQKRKMTDTTNVGAVDSQRTTVREGRAEISFNGPAQAFYNPVQEFNRDLTYASSLISNKMFIFQHCRSPPPI